MFGNRRQCSRTEAVDRKEMKGQVMKTFKLAFRNSILPTSHDISNYATAKVKCSKSEMSSHLQTL